MTEISWCINACEKRLLVARIDELVAAIKVILAKNDEFRAGMPDGWEGDPLQDACEAARILITSSINS
jgi:hypothetical protein